MRCDTKSIIIAFLSPLSRLLLLLQRSKVRTDLAQRVTFVQVKVTLHKDARGAIHSPKHQAAFMTWGWDEHTGLPLKFVLATTANNTQRWFGLVPRSPVLTGKFGMSWYLKVCLLEAASARSPSPELQMTATFGRCLVWFRSHSVVSL